MLACLCCCVCSLNVVFPKGMDVFIVNKNRSIFHYLDFFLCLLLEEKKDSLS